MSDAAANRRFSKGAHCCRGRRGSSPRWLSWGTQGKTSLLLDTPRDGGIRMTDTKVDLEGVARQLAADPTVASQAERCELFERSFRWLGDVDMAALAPDCAGDFP